MAPQPGAWASSRRKRGSSCPDPPTTNHFNSEWGGPRPAWTSSRLSSSLTFSTRCAEDPRPVKDPVPVNDRRPVAGPREQVVEREIAAADVVDGDVAVAVAAVEAPSGQHLIVGGSRVGR